MRRQTLHRKQKGFAACAGWVGSARVSTSIYVHVRVSSTHVSCCTEGEEGFQARPCELSWWDQTGKGCAGVASDRQ